MLTVLKRPINYDQSIHKIVTRL
jgi:hypothetical protein